MFYLLVQYTLTVKRWNPIQRVHYSGHLINLMTDSLVQISFGSVHLLHLSVYHILRIVDVGTSPIDIFNCRFVLGYFIVQC